MDISKEYIKMCEKAEEIQEYKNKEITFERGDFVANPYCLGGETVSAVSGFLRPKGIIWLPRQDQLQGMVNEEQTDMGKLCYFHDWIGLVNKWHFKRDMSMEQLWLAFVMKEKYQKRWDGEKWQLS